VPDPVCDGCGLPLIWAHTPAGARAPIVRDPAEDGNVLLLRHSVLGILAIQLTKDLLDQARKQGVDLRLNHFASCPNRAQFARGRARARAT
jgi:hypothetical protein